MAKSLVAGNKSKNFTFRITDALSNNLAEVKAKCAQHGMRLNVTEALTAALEREIKAINKAIKEVDPDWLPGQGSLDIDSANAHTKAGGAKPKK